MQLLQAPTGLQAPQVHRTCRRPILWSRTPVTHNSFRGRCASRQAALLLQVKLGPLTFTSYSDVLLDISRAAHWRWRCIAGYEWGCTLEMAGRGTSTLAVHLAEVPSHVAEALCVEACSSS